MYKQIRDAPTDTLRGTGSDTRIVIYRSGALGDMITSFPVFSNLRAAYPTSSITLIGPPDASTLAVSSDLVDEIVSSDSAWIAQWYMRDPTAVADVLGRIDLAFLYTDDNDRSLSETLRAIGTARVIVHPPNPPRDMKRHVTDFALESLDLLGVPVLTRTPFVIPDMKLECNSALGTVNRPFLFAHPGSSSASRTWPDLVDCAAEIASEYSLDLVVNRGPIEVERGFRASDNVAARILGPFDVQTLAAVVSRASLYIGNDTGPTHLAAALGVPTIAIFGPHSNPVQWAPRGPLVEVVYREGRWPTCDAVRKIAERLETHLTLPRTDVSANRLRTD